MNILSLLRYLRCPAETLNRTFVSCDPIFRRLGEFMHRCRIPWKIKLHSTPEALSLHHQDLSRPANVCVVFVKKLFFFFFFKLMGHWSCCILYFLNVDIFSFHYDHIPSSCLLSPPAVPAPPVPCEHLFYLLLSTSQKHPGRQFWMFYNIRRTSGKVTASSSCGAGLQGLGVSYGVVSGCADDIMMCLPMQWEL